LSPIQKTENERDVLEDENGEVQPASDDVILAKDELENAASLVKLPHFQIHLFRNRSHRYQPDLSS